MSDPVAPSQSQTLLDVLELRAAEQPNAEAYTFLIDGETQEESLTYGELYHRAQVIAAKLQCMGDAGERALLLCPAGLDYFAAFFGCVCSGLVAVLAYAPHPEWQLERLHNIVRSSQPRVGITTRAALPGIRRAFAAVPDLSELQWILADEMQSNSESLWRWPNIDSHSLVYLGYTSGSTSAPKGVAKAHSDLLLGPITGLYDEPERHHRVVNWTPPHTAAGVITPICNGIPATHMSPEAFLERPARWIELMSRTRATYCIVPNFAYDLAIDAIPPEERSGLDLSNWKYAFNAGEQVRAETIERFEDAFAVSGLGRGTVQPAYGLSEAVGISTAETGKRPTMLAFDRMQLEQGRVVRLPRGNTGARVLVGQGKPNSQVEVLIVDPESLTRCEPSRVGEIWTAGQHVATGYWNAPEETRAAFEAHLADTGQGPYFRTGDLGFLYNDEIFITGRLKEVIIIRGRNVHAVDVELVAQKTHPALERRAGAAFAVETGKPVSSSGQPVSSSGQPVSSSGKPVSSSGKPVSNSGQPDSRTGQPVSGSGRPVSGSGRPIPNSGIAEQLIIVHEINGDYEPAGLAEVADAIRRAVSSELGIQAHAVALVPAGAIPRTDTGKLRRAACRTAYLDGTLPLLFVSARDIQDSVRRTPYVPPTTKAERDLVEIWERVLNMRPIGIHDAFADLGGDSLSSVQVHVGIKEAGLPVTTGDIHRYRTIAALAAAISARHNAPHQDVGPGPETVRVGSETGWPEVETGLPAVGAVSLTSNQYWLLELGEQRPSWSVTASLLQSTQPLQARLLEQALQFLVFHHDALRLRCFQRDGGWIGEYAAHTPGHLVWFRDLSAKPELEPRWPELETGLSADRVQEHAQDDRVQHLRQEIARLRASIDMERGPLIRVGLVHFGDAPDLVVLCLSHLVSDAVSTGILIRDLDAVYAQLARGDAPRLPPRTSTIPEWARRAAAFARSDAMREEVGYWRRIMSHEPTRLALASAVRPAGFDLRPAGSNLGTREPGQDQVLSVHLGTEATTALQCLGQIGLSDVVHYALARALSEEVGTSSVSYLTMSHGRSPIFSDIDLSRTVGWLAQWIPLHLQVGTTSDHMAHARAIGTQMREMPHHGMGYGILRMYTDAELRSQVPDVALPIRLNYLGDVDRFSGEMAVFSSAPEWDALVAQEEANTQVPWHPRIEISVSIEKRVLQLWITYHNRAYLSETIERFAGRILDIFTEMTVGARSNA